MELSYLLVQQICQLFIIIFMGFMLVKTKLLTANDSKVLSKLALFVAAPCAILSSFAISFTMDKLVGLGFAFLAALLVHVIYIPLANVLSKIFGFSPVEKATIIYSNSGNLIIPLVGAIIGKEWVLYTSGYMIVQTILLWTHGKNLVCNENSFDLRKIFLNINVIAIGVGIIVFLFQIQLPTVIHSTLDTVGGMLGPLAMIVIGMLIGEMDFLAVFKQKRVYLITLFRLLIFPLLMVFIFKVTGLTGVIEDATQILLITTLAASAPAAASITQFAQLYDKQPSYASAMNVITVVFSIISMPLVIMIYQM